MKHIISKISAVCCASVTCFCMASALSVSAANIMGDINGDLRVDSSDAIGALKNYTEGVVGINDFSANAENCALDVTLDGQIDSDDAIGILRYFTAAGIGETLLWKDLRKTSFFDGPYKDDIKLPYALKGLYLEIGCASGAPGETVTVPLYIAGCSKLAGFQYYQNVSGDLEPTAISTQLTEMTGEKPTVNLCYGDGNSSTALVWANSDGRNIDISDGYVLAEYSYRIPEDAVSGDTYVLSADLSSCMFCTEDVTSITGEGIYQMTLLDGVISVN